MRKKPGLSAPEGEPAGRKVSIGITSDGEVVCRFRGIGTFVWSAEDAAKLGAAMIEAADVARGNTRPRGRVN